MTAEMQTDEPEVGFWLTGSLPPDLGYEGVQPFLRKHLRPGPNDVLTGGEVLPPEQVWIVPYSNELATAAGLRNIERYSSKVWHFAVRLAKGLRSNRHMTLDDVPPMHMAECMSQCHPLFEQQGYQGTTYKVEFYSPVAHKMFSGALYVDIRHLEDRTVDELWKIHKELGEEKYRQIKVQLSVPFEFWADALKFEGMEKRTAHYAKQLESLGRVIKRAPNGTRFAFHICYGDLGGKPAVPKWRQRTLAKIAMINAILDMPVWKLNRWILDTIHEPFGDGKRAPRKLSKKVLDLYREHLHNFPDGTAYAIGILHERYRISRFPRLAGDITRLQSILRTKGVRRFYLSTHCGLGRKSVENAAKVLRQHGTIKKLLRTARA